MSKWNEIRVDVSKGEWSLSASQVSTFESCKRKWRLSKVDRAMSPDQLHFDLGTCLHAACENLLQDKEAFPRDFDWLSLHPEDQNLVRLLVRLGQEDGIIRTLGDRDKVQVEPGFRVELVPGVYAVGFIDVLEVDHGSVSDWKTCASPKWTKTSEDLAQDLQLSLYAVALNQERVARGLEPLDEVTVRHGQFIKPKAPYHGPSVQETLAVITRAQMDATLEYLREVAAQMAEIRAARSWTDVPVPEEKNHKGVPKACMAYGKKCEFWDICTRKKEIWKHNDDVRAANRNLRR